MRFRTPGSPSVARGLLLLLVACGGPGPAERDAVDLSACTCSDGDGCLYACCAPVDPVDCTDCDCDGHVRAGADGDDCDDDDPDIHPGAVEYAQCDLANPEVHGGPDGIDNDCDGLVDEDAAPAPELCNGLDDDCDELIDEGVTTPFYEDRDGDGWGSDVRADACEAPSGYVVRTGDADDGDAAVHP